ncbi:MAG: DUF1684 domain-containing protein [Acidobacteriaceae bacterium]|nr:DUF1684 domain-containing protein [Acidobacteriaceae bacterium]MBV9499129.1 DUF1684 domain-containing protein [Acidobacteriaceae bacterium]
MGRFLIGFAVFSLTIMASSNYQESIHDWQQQRDAGLRSPSGWLSLVGLFWLKAGDNTIGSAASNNFVLPKGSAPARAGTLRLENNKVTFMSPDGSQRPLSYDEDKPTVIHAGTVSFFVIKRSDRLAVRATDSASPVLKNFQGMKYFPVDPELRFQAKFVPDKRMIPILNIVGQSDQEESPGIVEFTYRGQSYHLRPIYEGQTLFFLFKDPTNKTETYQAGRMLNTPLPENGKVDLDFNRSYNPPCTFTPYATCPLPPRENTLPFPVTAGEKRYGKGHIEYAESP